MLARRIGLLLLTFTTAATADPFSARFAGEQPDDWSIITASYCRPGYSRPQLKIQFSEPDGATHCDPGGMEILKGGFKYFSECEAFRLKHVEPYAREIGLVTKCGVVIE